MKRLCFGSGRAGLAAVILTCLWVTGQGQDKASLLSTFETAKTHFNSADQSQALPQLSQIIEAVSLVPDSEQMDPEMLELYVKSLEMRGLVYYGSGEQDKAATDFYLLARTRPDHTLDPSQASPKIVTFYDEIRAKVLGKISVKSEPSGAEVFWDGQTIGTTPLMDKAVVAGTHRLTLRMGGYREVEESLQVAPSQAVERTIALEASRCRLSLVSDPSGAKVYLGASETPVGTTPLKDQEVSAGDQVLLVVAEGVGRWFDRVALKKDDRVELSCSVRPTLLFAGVSQEAEGPAGSDLASRFSQVLDSLQSLNVLLPGQPRYPAGVSASWAKMSRKERGEKLPGWAKSAQADLILVLLLPSSKDSPLASELVGSLKDPLLSFPGSCVMELYSDEQGMCDLVSFPANDPAAMEQCVARMDRFTVTLQDPWLGLSCVDTTLGKGAYVVRVSPGSTGEEAGIAPGDILTSVNSKPVTGAREILAETDQARNQAKLSIERIRAGSAQTLSVAVGWSPRLIPSSDADLLYTQALKSLQLRGRMNKTLDKGIVDLNGGICYLNLQAWDKALACFRQISLPGKSGVNDGTVQYFIGECFKSMGNRAEAIRAYENASSHEESTFGSHSTVRVKPAALARLKELGS